MSMWDVVTNQAPLVLLAIVGIRFAVTRLERRGAQVVAVAVVLFTMLAASTWGIVLCAVSALDGPGCPPELEQYWVALTFAWLAATLVAFAAVVLVGVHYLTRRPLRESVVDMREMLDRMMEPPI